MKGGFTMNKKMQILAILSLFFIFTAGTQAAEKGSLRTYAEPGTEELEKKNNDTVMITIFKGAQPIDQREITVYDESNTLFRRLLPGTYKVRYEGPGLKTTEKDGILVFPEKETSVRTFLFEGTGIITYKYSTALIPVNLTDMEIDKRIEQLKREIEYLKSLKR